MSVRLAPLLLAAGLAVVLVGCGAPAASDTASTTRDRPTVVAAFAPLASVASAVAGDTVEVITLTPPGVEPHDLELSASQVAEIAAADLVLYVPGFQPAVDEAITQQAGDRAIAVTDGLTLRTTDGAADPHVWLDPRRMQQITDTVAMRLAPLAPDAAANAKAFDTALADLDTDYRTALGTCASHTMVVSHEAFGYLADAYGLTQVGISGLSPEAEPSPARLAEVADAVRANDVRTIYTETLVDPKVAQTLADEAGVRTAVLDPIETIPDGGTYDSIMRANLEILREGQRCA